MMDYQFRDIELKWRKQWEKTSLYKVNNDPARPKYYVLDMFPYPSGAGLHVGHPLGYIASDIFARYKRMKGFNVLHPMGFDAFGLPAEQYAIETGQHPAVTTEQNIRIFKEQLENIGFCYDWSREFKTADPSYYRWTQWLFLQIYHSWFNRKTGKAEHIETLIALFEKEGNSGVNAANDQEEKFTANAWNAMTELEKETVLGHYRLAYPAFAEVNWCEALGTVLANDEVKDGFSERGGHPVVRKKMRQWFLRITAYADRLLEGLESLDWSKPMKEMQRNWIGRSEGAEIRFKLKGHEDELLIFTTRPDTIFGATFMVLAPEHELVSKITTGDKKGAIDAYLTYAKSRTDVDRQATKQVTGEFTGAYAIHPFTSEEIPVWIAEYVLAGYGTGAIMAVPADDERDQAFAKKFSLPIIEVVDRSAYPGSATEDKVGKMINSDLLNGMEVKDAIALMLNEVEQRGIGRRKVNFRLRDAGFSRQRYWGEPIPVRYENGIPKALKADELPLILPETNDFKPSADGRSPLAKIESWKAGHYETDTMPGYAGSSWYFLRYMDPQNENAFVGKDASNYWGQVDLYLGGAEHAVGHLLYSRLWTKIFCDLGLISFDEPFKKMVNQGMIQGRSSLAYRINGTNTFVSKGLKDQHEVTELHVDVNIVENDVLDIERFKAWREDYKNAEFILEDGQYHCGVEIEKMSKRWYNVVNPNDMVSRYGADCFRMYEMFLGPIEDSKPWNTQGIDGVSKFLRKLWRLFYDEKGNYLVSDEAASREEMKVLHKTIKKISDDLERFSHNTCVSGFMICVNELGALKCHKKEVLAPLLRLLAPFAPFITEELWEKMGNASSVHVAEWPLADESYLVENSFEYPISINGKVRSKLSFNLDSDNTFMEEAVRNEAGLQKYLDGKEIKKVIIVKGRIINVVLG